MQTITWKTMRSLCFIFIQNFIHFESAMLDFEHIDERIDDKNTKNDATKFR